MKKHKGLTPTRKSRQKDHNAIAAKSKSAQHPQHSINVTPLVHLLKRVNHSLHRRAFILVALGISSYALNAYDTAPIRQHDAAAPYITRACFKNTEANGYWRRWAATDASTSCSVAVSQTLSWGSLLDAYEADCMDLIEATPLRLRRSELWLRNRNSTNPSAQPQPEEIERIQAQVASFEEGMTP